MYTLAKDGVSQRACWPLGSQGAVELTTLISTASGYYTGSQLHALTAWPGGDGESVPLTVHTSGTACPSAPG